MGTTLGAAMRSQLEHHGQYETLASDLRCLSDALQAQPLPPSTHTPMEGIPLEMAWSSDCHWSAASTRVRTNAEFSREDVLELEERTIRLLAELGSAPELTGPLQAHMLAAATPKPYKPRGDSSVNASTLQRIDEMPSIADVDLQPPATVQRSVSTSEKGD